MPRRVVPPPSAVRLLAVCLGAAVVWSLLGGTPVVGFRQQYDVAPDGRFLINVNVDEGTAAPITVITNWHPEGKK